MARGRQREVKVYTASDLVALVTAGKAKMDPDGKVKTGSHKDESGKEIADYVKCDRIDIEVDEVTFDDITAIFDPQFTIKAIEEKVNRDWSLTAKNGSPEVQRAKIVEQMAALQAKLEALAK